MSSTGYEDGWELKVLGFFVGGEVNTYVEAEQQNIVDVVLNVKENTITTKSAI